jgi:hypothetical protein
VQIESVVGAAGRDVLRARRLDGGGDWVTLGGKPVILVPENIVSIVAVLCGPVQGPEL